MFAIVASASANRPPPPSPCTALKATSWSMFWARPQSAEPTRKIEIATMYSGRRPTPSASASPGTHLLSRLRGRLPPAGEKDPRPDREAARDLVPRQVLREEDQRDDRREERLEVREDRGARGADAVDGREPE